ncbi:metallophosphoesterase [Deinococcus oregonensis]|uniref:Metallophosphoesterase n=1 Tax=Deinococcus oregonensis TaxID=1805970 RepID=A0ABV6AXS6_9DEIO
MTLRLPLVIPDLHGCSALLNSTVTQYPDRRFVFLGDYLDRGPDAPGVIRQVRELVEAGRAEALWGNHDAMFVRAMLEDDGTPRPIEHALVSLWDFQTLFQWPKIEAAQADARWMRDHLTQWSRVEHVYLSHAAPHIEERHWGDAPDHLWKRPDQCREEGRAPLPDGCTLAIHGHTPTPILHPDSLALPTRFDWPDGTQSVYLDCAAFHTGQLAVLDLETFEVNMVTLAAAAPDSP